jgi:hypothetical protein
MLHCCFLFLQAVGGWLMQAEATILQRGAAAEVHLSRRKVLRAWKAGVAARCRKRELTAACTELRERTLLGRCMRQWVEVTYLAHMSHVALHFRVRRLGCLAVQEWHQVSLTGGQMDVFRQVRALQLGTLAGFNASVLSRTSSLARCTAVTHPQQTCRGCNPQQSMKETTCWSLQVASQRARLRQLSVELTHQLACRAATQLFTSWRQTAAAQQHRRRVVLRGLLVHWLLWSIDHRRRNAAWRAARAVLDSNCRMRVFYTWRWFTQVS